MHPAIFIPAFTLIGMLFALQEWLSLHLWGYHIRGFIIFESWGAEYLTWGILCWLLWRTLNPFILRAHFRQILIWILPLSFVAGLLQEMVTVALFPRLPLDLPPMHYWQRVAFHFRAEMLDNFIVFWFAFFLFRGFGYYQQLRQNERTAAQLETQLAKARLSALRMQLNPHFLFNAMNSISSVMQVDVKAADTMLEQLSNLLRMTLEREDTQLIPLQEEMAFIETYLEMQAQRYSGRITQQIAVAPELHDALVPAMLLQPLVENAFVHGLSRLSQGGELRIAINDRDNEMRILISNNGLQAEQGKTQNRERPGVGLENIKSRLRLLYGNDAKISAGTIAPTSFQVNISLPLQFAPSNSEKLLRYD
jgi:hypothetical protein